MTKIIKKNIKFGLLTLTVMTLFFASPLKAQVNVGSADAPKSFSVLELSTKQKQGGLLLPQLTNAQRDNLAVASNPDAKGLVIYNTDAKCIQFWNGTKWINLPLKTA